MPILERTHPIGKLSFRSFGENCASLQFFVTGILFLAIDYITLQLTSITLQLTSITLQLTSITLQLTSIATIDDVNGLARFQ
jgi:hypothetical protein